MNWYTALKPPGLAQESFQTDVSHPDWLLCSQCFQPILKKNWEHALKVCPSCHHHAPLTATERIRHLIDGEFHVLGEELQSHDFLKFVDTQPYGQRLHQAQQRTQQSEALSIGHGLLGSHRVVCAVFDFGFIGGSMGQVVGQRFVTAVRFAQQHRLPLICIASSGGARMQEGVLSLMQMVRTSAALAQLARERIPYLVVLASPCMGGVSASLASLGDLTIAEPRAIIGFTGPKVIEQTVGKKLPAGFQTSEFLKEKGFLDAVVHRAELKPYLSRFLKRWTHSHKEYQ